MLNFKLNQTKPNKYFGGLEFIPDRDIPFSLEQGFFLPLETDPVAKKSRLLSPDRTYQTDIFGLPTDKTDTPVWFFFKKKSII